MRHGIYWVDRLDHKPLDLVLEGADLVHEIGGLVGGDGGGDDGAGDTAGTSESGLRWNVDVWDVLILAEEWEVEEDGQWSGVGSEDDDLGDSAVEGLGGLVGALLQLAVVGCLLDDIEDLLGKGRIGDWPCWEKVSIRLEAAMNWNATYRHQSSAPQTY